MKQSRIITIEVNEEEVEIEAKSIEVPDRVALALVRMGACSYEEAKAMHLDRLFDLLEDLEAEVLGAA